MKNVERAMISIGAESKGLDRDLADAKKKVRAFGADASKSIKNAFGKARKLIGGAGGVLGKAGSMVGAGFGMQIAGGAGDMLADLLSFEKGLTRFQIATGKSTVEMFGLRSAILQVSKETGVAQADVLGGAQAYVDLTGDVKGAELAMRSFARVSQASGASVSDIATATAALQQSMGIEASDIETVFSGLITQGKQGAVSLKDFASELSSLAPRWAKFAGGTGTRGIKGLGAAFQVARQGFGSASEAATGLEALMGAVTLNAKKFEKAGVKVFDKNPKTGVKTMKSFDEIMRSIGNSKLMKDPTLLTKAMGSKEAEQTFTMLNRNRDLFEQLVTAGADAGAVQRDLATYQQSAAGKIEAAWNGVKIALAEAFTPERIAAFANALKLAADVLAKIVGYASQAKEYIDKAANYAKYGTTESPEEQAKRRAAGLSKKESWETPEIARKNAAYMRQQASNIYTKSGGVTPQDEVQMKALELAAAEYERRGDLWGAGGAKASLTTSSLEDPLARKVENEVMGRRMVEGVKDAIIEGFAKAKLELKADGNKIADTVANAKSPEGALVADYLRASFGGVPMHIMSIDTDHGHDVAVQSPSSGDNHANFDRGRRVNLTRAEVYFVDRAGMPPHLERYQAFRDLANSQTDQAYVLVHPLDGAYPARVEGVTASATSTEVGIRVNCTFIRESSDEETSPVLDGATSVAGFESVHAAAEDTKRLLAELEAPLPVPPEIDECSDAVESWLEAEDELDPQQVFLEAAALVRGIDAAIARLDLLADLDRWQTYRAMIELRYEVVRAAESITSRAAPMFELLVRAPRPLLAICAEIYGAAAAPERASEVARRNRVRTPGRVQAGTTLVMEKP